MKRPPTKAISVRITAEGTLIIPPCVGGGSRYVFLAMENTVSRRRRGRRSEKSDRTFAARTCWEPSNDQNEAGRSLTKSARRASTWDGSAPWRTIDGRG